MCKAGRRKKGETEEDEDGGERETGENCVPVVAAAAAEISRESSGPRQSLHVSRRPRGELEGGKASEGVGAVRAAHRFRGPQAVAERRPFRPSEQRAAKVGQQLHAGDAGGFAVRHAGNRGSDRGRDAARAARRTAAGPASGERCGGVIHHAATLMLHAFAAKPGRPELAGQPNVRSGRSQARSSSAQR